MSTHVIPQVSCDRALCQKIIHLSLKEILLYGIGTIGKRTFHDFKAMGITIVAILESDTRLHGQTYEGVSISPPEDYAGTDMPVIIASSAYYAEIFFRVKKLNFANILPYYFYLSGREVDSTEYVAMLLEHNRLSRQIEKTTCDNYSKFKIKSVDVAITEKCSLRCKDCSNLMQYFQHPRDMDYERCMKAFNRLMQVIDRIGEIRILGGEPLMNPDLIKYISAIKAYDSFDYLILLTNATMLPSEALLRCLEDARVIVRISDYDNKKQKCDKWVSLLEQRGILYAIEKITLWHDCGTLKHYNRTEAENRDIFRVCCVRDVPSIKDGRLYRCPLAGSVDALSACPPETAQYVDLLDDTISNDLLREKVQGLMSLKWLYVCDYCGGRPYNQPSIPAARQVIEPVKYVKYGEDLLERNGKQSTDRPRDGATD